MELDWIGLTDCMASEICIGMDQRTSTFNFLNFFFLNYAVLDAIFKFDNIEHCSYHSLLSHTISINKLVKKFIKQVYRTLSGLD